LTVDISRGYLHKSLSATTEFIIESDKGIFWFSPIIYFYVFVND